MYPVSLRLSVRIAVSGTRVSLPRSAGRNKRGTSLMETAQAWEAKRERVKEGRYTLLVRVGQGYGDRQRT